MLDFLFSPLLIFDSSLAILIFAVIILFLINLPYKFLIDQNESKRIKESVKEINNKMRQKQKEGNMDESNKLLKEAMQENSKLMRMSMKPMLVSFLIVILTIPWIVSSYPDIQVSMENDTGNFTLHNNYYDVRKDGGTITISGLSAVRCESVCIKNIENNLYEIKEEKQNIKLAHIVALLPVSLPFVGSNLGWLIWYLIISIPVAILIRKFMKISV